MKRINAMVALAAMGLAAPAWAATDAECQDMWKKADANSDGVLSDKESIRYVALMRVGNRTVATEGRITQAEFMDACKADIYAPRKADAGAPLVRDCAAPRRSAYGGASGDALRVLVLKFETSCL
jgi:hypothetical protein